MRTINRRPLCWPIPRSLLSLSAGSIGLESPRPESSRPLSAQRAVDKPPIGGLSGALRAPGGSHGSRVGHCGAPYGWTYQSRLAVCPPPSRPRPANMSPRANAGAGKDRPGPSSPGENRPDREAVRAPGSPANADCRQDARIPSVPVRTGDRGTTHPKNFLGTCVFEIVPHHLDWGIVSIGIFDNTADRDHGTIGRGTLHCGRQRSINALSRARRPVQPHAAHSKSTKRTHPSRLLHNQHGWIVRYGSLRIARARWRNKANSARMAV